MSESRLPDFRAEARVKNRPAVIFCPECRYLEYAGPVGPGAYVGYPDHPPAWCVRGHEAVAMVFKWLDEPVG